MADSVAVMISTASVEAVAAALDLVAAAATIEMGAHIAAADVPPEVDSPAEMATFLSLARKATVTLNF
jgi:hypothetical protein